MRTWLTQLAMGLMLTLTACAPTVNSQSGQSRSLPSSPATPSPAVPASPAAGTAVKAAILLPLSGPQASLGQSLLNAAQLAVYDVAGPDFALLPHDTAGDPAQALAATRQAMADGASLIIGPVFSAEVEQIAPTARARPVPVLALSNNKTLASSGIYILGPSPDDQVARVLAYAKARGIGRIAALVPASAYGQAVEQAVRMEIQQQGLSLVQLQRTAPGADPVMVAGTLAGSLAATGGADAVLIGEGGARLVALAQALRGAGITARFLGTAAWEANQAHPDPALAGSWFAALATGGREGFRGRYQQTYGAAPAPIATLAYDATALAAVVARQNGGYGGNRLLGSTGFSGIDGLFRLRADGSTERALAVYELTNAGVRVVDPAPARFAASMN